MKKVLLVSVFLLIFVVACNKSAPSHIIVKDLGPNQLHLGEGTILTVNMSVPEHVARDEFVPVEIVISLQPVYWPNGSVLEDTIQIKGALLSGTDVLRGNKEDIPPLTLLQQPKYTVRSTNDIRCEQTGETSVIFELEPQFQFVSQGIRETREIITQQPNQPQILRVNTSFSCVPKQLLDCRDFPWDVTEEYVLEDGTSRYETKGSCVRAQTSKYDRYIEGDFLQMKRFDWSCRSPASATSAQPTEIRISLAAQGWSNHELASFDDLTTIYSDRFDFNAYNTCDLDLVRPTTVNPFEAGDIAVARCHLKDEDGENAYSYIVQKCDDIIEGSTCVQSSPTGPARCQLTS